MKISRCMSTQHPDNVNIPFFAESSELTGDDEIKEAFYSYSHLQCREQLWDCEGKEVDAFVVKKLLSKYEPYFRRKRLGRDVFLTLRVPNPSVEKNEAKILLETLEGIPRNFDTAALFYGDDIAPIFEVAMPMCTSDREIIRVAEYYKTHVVGKQLHTLSEGDIAVSDWIGKFSPESIRLIPLMEDKETILNPQRVIEGYVKSQRINDYLRVWLARSDPALNYGSLTTVLMLKISLQKIRELSEKLSVELPPILGCGSAPFRGNFRPTNIRSFMKGYPSVHTYTLQSAFKYDYPVNQVAEAIEEVENSAVCNPVQVDEKRCLDIIEKLTNEYQRHVKLIAPMINEMAPYVPSRRKRKLHIGLFGYSRNVAEVKLPRAITFCAAMYSYGLPPELIGLSALDGKDVDYIRSVYANFDNDLKDSLCYLNEDNLRIFPHEVAGAIRKAASFAEYEPDLKHRKVTSIIADDYSNRNFKLLTENITRAGFIRRFLG
ncbi:phosphoenolpyruvate carboxylase [Candidatus Woesearchaeota archaeon]|nr:phosphoenolpyruvate carboxylase [Candidatus Woesearchaeota archaeon]